MPARFIKKYRPHPESFWVIVLLALLLSFTSISVDLITPSLPVLTKIFDSTSNEIKLLINAFFFGFAIAHLFWGVLSDRFGRRLILITGILLYILATFACLFSTELELLIVYRFLQGIGGASCTILSRAVIRDIYGAERATKAMSSMILVFVPIPIFMPIIGGFLITQFEWTSLFWLMLISSILTLLLVIIILTETAPSKIVGSTRIMDVERGFLPVIKNRFFVKNTLANMFCFASLLLCVTNFPHFLYHNYNFTPQQVGWFFALFDGGLGAGVIAVRFIVPRVGIKKTLFMGFYLTSFAWSVLMTVQFFSPGMLPYSASAIVLSCVGMGIVISLTPGQAMVPFTQNSGTASALYGIIQYGGGTLMVLVLNSFQFEGALAVIIIAAIASYLSLFSFWLFGD
ncbi:MAG: multidrug effflux MFS transporter [Gammaproteobacteria bacterium]|jgi:MFS transporter, DHA1 family, multidrug resistance protein|nr:multidrug effflux MFS transporter [Gammaproteobacteria bacterium]